MGIGWHNVGISCAEPAIALEPLIFDMISHNYLFHYIQYKDYYIGYLSVTEIGKISHSFKFPQPAPSRFIACN